MLEHLLHQFKFLVRTFGRFLLSFRFLANAGKPKIKFSPRHASIDKELRYGDCLRVCETIAFRVIFFC